MLLAREGAKVVVNDLGGGPIGGGSAIASRRRWSAKSRSAASSRELRQRRTIEAERASSKPQPTASGPHILINNAGIVRPRIIYNMSEATGTTSSRCT